MARLPVSSAAKVTLAAGIVTLMRFGRMISPADTASVSSSVADKLRPYPLPGNVLRASNKITHDFLISPMIKAMIRGR